MKIKPDYINIAQIMKKYFYPLFVTLLVFEGLIISPANLLAQSVPPAPSPVCASCERTINQINTVGHGDGCLYGNSKKSSSSGSSGGGYSGSSQNMQMEMMRSIIQPFLDNLFAPPDYSGQEEQIRRQNEQRRLEEEKLRQQQEQQKRDIAIQRWLKLQNEEAMNRQIADKAKTEQGEKVLSQMQTVGSGKLEPFNFGNPKLDLIPVDQTYPAPSTAWEQALGAAYFSNLAKQSTKDVEARFYADQAGRVMTGEPTYIECKIPKVSNEKLAEKMEKVKQVYDEINIKFNDLKDIEGKLTETREKIKKAEIKKEEATAKIDDLKNRAIEAKPEEKAKADDGREAALKELQDAEQELNQEKQSEKDQLNKKEQLENEFSKGQAEIQAIINKPE